VVEANIHGDRMERRMVQSKPMPSSVVLLLEQRLSESRSVSWPWVALQTKMTRLCIKSATLKMKSWQICLGPSTWVGG